MNRRGLRARPCTALLGGLLLAALGTGPAIGQTQPGRPGDDQLRRQLLDATAGRARIVDHDRTGRVRFLGTDPDRPVPRPANIPAGAPSEVAARGFLNVYGQLFGADDHVRQLRLERASDADRGRSTVRFQQVHDGVPVLGGELVVNLDEDRDVISANGELSPELQVSVKPSLAGRRAQEEAITAIAKANGLDRRQLEASAAALWVYDPVLLGGPTRRPPSLVWRTEVTAEGVAPVRELVLVDAETGAISLHFNQIADAKERRICDRNNLVKEDETCAAPYTRTESSPATGIADVDAIYDRSGEVYDYFLTNFGRDGIDGAGLPLVSTVRYCPAADECPYANAFWNGSQMTFGQGFTADDIVSHELAHGVTEFEAGLLYYYQSGAINESLSDVFGEVVDLGNGVGNDSPVVRWEIGEDLPMGTLRNMSNPPARGDPDSMLSPNYWTAPEDNGGVHTNSGVNNKAAFLMADGGSFNGVTVAGLGLAKVGQIYYEVDANMLTSGSDYQDLSVALKQACLNKVGTVGITTADCNEVQKAATATKMDQPPPGGLPEAPVCPVGQTPTDLFFDDMEDAGGGNWAFAGTGGGGWNYATGFATSGVLDLYGQDPPTTSNRTASRTAGVVPAPGKATYLRFNHSYQMEKNFDGGLVEYSTNGGGTWTDARPLFVNNGYNHTNTAGPLAGRAVFSDRSMGYGSSRLDLSSLAGQNVRYRFRIMSDASVGDFGWDIDDVRVYSCGVKRPVADFTGDAKTDVSVFRPSSGGWFVSDGATTTYGQNGDIPVPADYDGDSRTDTAVYRPSVGTWYIHNSQANTDTLVTYGVASDIPVPADYDGDGRADIAVYRPSTPTYASGGTWYVHNSATNTDTIVTFGGIQGDIPVPGDYDGDERADLAIFRPAEGGWYVRNSADASVASVSYGQNGDIPTPGDFDGDGRTDTAVYRPSVGTWYVHNSQANTDTLLTYGVGTDVPQVGDYDGDGRSDIAIYRPSTAAWYARYSGNGTDLIVTYGVGGDVPLPMPAAIRRFFY